MPFTAEKLMAGQDTGRCVALKKDGSRCTRSAKKHDRCTQHAKTYERLGLGSALDYTAILNERLAFGRYPFPPDRAVEELEAHGFTVFVDLTTPRDNVAPYQEYLSGGSTYLHYPIEDRTLPEDVTAFVVYVNRLVDGIGKGANVYAHCRGGHERSAALAAVLFAALNVAHSTDEVFQKVRQAHQDRKEMKPEWRLRGALRTVRQQTFVRDCLMAIRGRSGGGLENTDAKAEDDVRLGAAPVVPVVVRLQRKDGVVVQGCTLYIGRAWNMGGWSLPASKWHNAFALRKHGLEGALTKYEEHVRGDPKLLAALPELSGQVLGCWCKGKNLCHGDVLVKLFLERYPEAIAPEEPPRKCIEEICLQEKKPLGAVPARERVHGPLSAKGERTKAMQFGIFIHWGAYAVPAFFPRPTRSRKARTVSNGSEWYYERLRRPGRYGAETGEYHAREFWGFDYYDFIPMFEEESREWTARGLVDKIAGTGAKYLIVTAKHHDGVALYPSEHGLHHTTRDYIAEFAAAAKTAGLAFGLYYSLMEWTPLYSEGKKTKKIHDYVAETLLPQMKELVARYQPDILWADGDWQHSALTWRSCDFLDWLFAESPVKDTVITNDRWGKQRDSLLAHYADRIVRTETDRYIPQSPEKQWEHVNTISASWGRAVNQLPEDYKSIAEIARLERTVKNLGGRLTLNVGPGPDGSLDPLEEQVLAQLVM